MNYLTKLPFGVTSMVVLATFALAAEPAPKAEKTRNPFGVKDVEDPDGEDVQEFAKQITLKGDKDDPNAEEWVKEATAGMKGKLDGQWMDRWADGKAVGRKHGALRVVGERVYILAHSNNGDFLLDLKKQGNRLVGRYRGIDQPADSTPCVFLIVDDERIDGYWAGGRWDFRRKLK